MECETVGGDLEPTIVAGSSAASLTVISSFRPALKRSLLEGSYPRKPQGTQNRVAPLTARLLFLLLA